MGGRRSSILHIFLKWGGQNDLQMAEKRSILMFDGQNDQIDM